MKIIAMKPSLLGLLLALPCWLLSQNLEQRIDDLLDRLYALEPDLDDNEKPVPVTVGLTPAGKEAWIAFYDDDSTAIGYAVSRDHGVNWTASTEYAAGTSRRSLPASASELVLPSDASGCARLR